MQFLRKILFLGVKYGWLNFIKIIFYEFLNLKRLRFFDYKFDYPVGKGEIYGPTFYYVLVLVKEHIELKKKVFIDFGCGRGRVLDYMKDYAKKVVGIENNKKFRKHFLNEKNIFFENCYNNNIIKELSAKYMNEKLVIFFYHPFDTERIEEIVSIFADKCLHSLHIILVGDIDINIKNTSMKKILVNRLIKIYQIIKS